MKLQRDLREFIELLSSHGVEYIVVGGHAVAYHGYPRFTGDIDVFVASTPDNAARVVAALDAFGFGSLGIDAATFATPDRIVQLGRPPNRIDLLTSISGVAFDEARATQVVAELDGIAVPFLGLDALLRNKRASGRAKDLADVEELERLPR